MLLALPALDAQPLAAAVFVILWGLTGYAFMTPQRARLVTPVSWAPGLALSLNASGLYAGSAVGGIIVDHAGLAPLGFGAATLLGVALLLLWASMRMQPAQQPLTQ